MEEILEDKETPRLGPRDLVLLAILMAVGAAIRLYFLSAQGIPRFDPWRHLLLVENLRAGRGFTLFAGQPYIWYPPFWHGFAALMPRALGLDQLAALLSLLTIPLTYVFARLGAKMSWVGAGVASLFMAASGPLVAFTCHYGPEAFALFLALGALCLVACARGLLAVLASGLVFSAAVFLRPSLALLGFLFIPYVLKYRRWVLFAAGGIVPAVFVGLWNHRVIAANPFIFTWDGLATSASGYGPLATLLPQLERGVRGIPSECSIRRSCPSLSGSRLAESSAGTRSCSWHLASSPSSPRGACSGSSRLSWASFTSCFSIGHFRQTTSVSPSAFSLSSSCPWGALADRVRSVGIPAIPVVFCGLRLFRSLFGSEPFRSFAHARARPHAASAGDARGEGLHGEQRLLPSRIPHGPIS